MYGRSATWCGLNHSHSKGAKIGLTIRDPQHRNQSFPAQSTLAAWAVDWWTSKTQQQSFCTTMPAADGEHQLFVTASHTLHFIPCDTTRATKTQCAGLTMWMGHIWSDLEAEICSSIHLNLYSSHSHFQKSSILRERPSQRRGRRRCSRCRPCAHRSSGCCDCTCARAQADQGTTGG